MNILSSFTQSPAIAQIGDSLTSSMPGIGERLKPIVLLVAVIALGILLVAFTYLQNSTQSLSWTRTVFLAKKMITPVTFGQLVENSQTFGTRIPFPTFQNLMQIFATTPELQQEVVTHAQTSRPVMHERVWSMIPKFLDFKKKFGTEIEQQLYKVTTPVQSVGRMIENRPLAFCEHIDQYISRTGVHGAGGFEQIGQKPEGELKLSEYQSYFEMSLAAFISMFVPTHFINDGNRKNKGAKAPDGTYEPNGIYVGMVGARFEKPGLMEWASMIVTPEQNTAENGYGKDAKADQPQTIEKRLWAELYQSKIGEEYALPSYVEAQADTSGRFLPLAHGYFLDTFVYKERLRLIVESYLCEADNRAKQKGKMAYCHAVGLGLGVWKVHDKQTELMLQVYAEVLKAKKFDHISDINFSYFTPSKLEGGKAGILKCGDAEDQGFVDSQGHKIKIHFSKRDPSAKLTGADEGKLLVAQYAWDSNSYPGNEYWNGDLAASGDPAAACCSMIPELQNPEINPYITAKNLAVVSAGA